MQFVPVVITSNLSVKDVNLWTNNMDNSVLRNAIVYT